MSGAPDASANILYLAGAVACVKRAGAVAAPGSDAAPEIALPQPDAPVVTLLGNGLCVVYLVEEGEHLAFVQNRRLDGVVGGAKALHAVGLANLSKLAEAKLRMRPYGDVTGLFLDGLFEASLILLDDLWDGPLAAQAPNGPVVALPTRDVLAFCDARSAPGIEALRALAARTVTTGDHVITDTLYRRQDGQWRPL
ncbi:MAG: hypothetical protein ABI699_00760 [Caldimonas sp.]